MRDIALGEQGLKKLLTERNMELEYFRFPMLHRGRSASSKERVAKFLIENGYTAAPVSIDNQEWVFARYYDRALAKQDTETMEEIGRAYVDYMENVFEFFENWSVEVLGYEPKQILLIHANALNTEYLDELAQMLLARNYAFISLDEAMTDPAYSLPESYVGPRGLSWLHRIAVTKGMQIQEEPREPQWLYDL